MSCKCKAPENADYCTLDPFINQLVIADGTKYCFVYKGQIAHIQEKHNCIKCRRPSSLGFIYSGRHEQLCLIDYAHNYLKGVVTEKFDAKEYNDTWAAEVKGYEGMVIKVGEDRFIYVQSMEDCYQDEPGWMGKEEFCDGENNYVVIKFKGNPKNVDSFIYEAVDKSHIMLINGEFTDYEAVTIDGGEIYAFMGKKFIFDQKEYKYIEII